MKSNAIDFHDYSFLDGEYNDSVIVGASNLNHLKENLSFFCQSRHPLSSSIIEAFEDAWKITRASCASYFR